MGYFSQDHGKWMWPRHVCMIFLFHVAVWKLLQIIEASQSEPHAYHPHEKIIVPMCVCMCLCSNTLSMCLQCWCAHMHAHKCKSNDLCYTILRWYKQDFQKHWTLNKNNTLLNQTFPSPPLIGYKANPSFKKKLPVYEYAAIVCELWFYEYSIGLYGFIVLTSIKSN